ncbi:MAG: hypothetical protein F4Y27_10765 [Acidimicrobiaceae bacterium]|nr:hypothetical protein [Acidimicrobiaceae bacterium]MXW74462.1 hypothetical protein [Acidimicrobiaceae bacterium]MYA75147.1 hypothetical protein [Acidimicrobiaceae bacterium]MYC43380.1 hypothetical protein [Acidimicrobiaceae bacterium]MYD07223.1 hypothetical protein [Acidimicrobiaceae bacterium]
MIFRRKPRSATVDLWDDPEAWPPCWVDAVGESHYQDQIREVVDTTARANPTLLPVRDGWQIVGVHCWLLHEPENEYDPNAIAVLLGKRTKAQPLKVGYLPATYARRTIKQGQFRGLAHVHGVIVGRDDNFGVKLSADDVLRAGVHESILDA